MATNNDPGGFGSDTGGSARDYGQTIDVLRASTDSLTVSANGFSSAISRAFVQATAGGKQLDDVFRTLALRISGLAVSQALKPLSTGIADGLNGLLGGLFPVNLGAATGAVKPFATGGVIGTPTYFPLSDGGLGLAGEAGPEAIVPLARGPDGRLGVTSQGGGGTATINVQISTPDADSFRRSESYVTGQIARAVARGQRSF